MLLHLDHETLKEIGLSSIGHRLILLKAVYNLKIAHGLPVEADNWKPEGIASLVSEIWSLTSFSGRC